MSQPLSQPALNFIPSTPSETHPPLGTFATPLQQDQSYLNRNASTSSHLSTASSTGKERKRRSFNPFVRDKAEDVSLISVIDGGLHASEYLTSSDNTKNRSRSASRVSLVPGAVRPEDLDADNSTPVSRTLAILTADISLQDRGSDNGHLSPTSDFGSPTSTSSKRRSRLSAIFMRNRSDSHSSNASVPISVDFSNARPHSFSKAPPGSLGPIVLSQTELDLFPATLLDSGPVSNQKLAEMPQNDILHLAVQMHSLSKSNTVVKKKHIIRKDELGLEENDPRLTLSTKMFIALAERGSKGGEILAGLALRHGWGIPANEAQGLAFLRSAASDAIGDLQSSLHSTGNSGVEAPEEERAYLRFAIYEVANSFLFGLGIEKNEKKGLEYLEMAAVLGDTDAMNGLADAYLAGRGPGGKRNKQKAATWYRKAEKAGATPIVGNSWIWKEKYGPVDI